MPNHRVPVHRRMTNRMDGGGFLDKLKGISQKVGSKVCPKGYVAKINAEENPAHMPCHNYTGPATDFEARVRAGVQPMNPVDAGSFEHDAVYNAVTKGLKSGAMDRQMAKKLVRDSDKELVRRVKTMSRPDAKIVQAAIQGKMVAEDTGALDPLKFVGSGKEPVPPNPIKALRKRAIKQHYSTRPYRPTKQDMYGDFSNLKFHKSAAKHMGKNKQGGAKDMQGGFLGALASIAIPMVLNQLM